MCCSSADRNLSGCSRCGECPQFSNTVSSVHGLRASEFKSAYVTAKHALEGLSRVTALEGGPHGVTSNCVNPGYVRTPLVEKQIADQARTHGIAESEVLDKIMLTHSAVKRLWNPTRSHRWWAGWSGLTRPW